MQTVALQPIGRNQLECIELRHPRFPPLGRGASSAATLVTAIMTPPEDPPTSKASFNRSHPELARALLSNTLSHLSNNQGPAWIASPSRKALDRADKPVHRRQFFALKIRSATKFCTLYLPIGAELVRGDHEVGLIVLHEIPGIGSELMFELCNESLRPAQTQQLPGRQTRSIPDIKQNRAPLELRVDEHTGVTKHPVDHRRFE